MRSSSSLRCSSRSQRSWASWMVFWTSWSSKSEKPTIWTSCRRRVAQSFAETERMPSRSISKVTSILGTPAGAGGMPSSLKVSNFLLSAAIGRSPCSTTTSMESCASSDVVKSRVPLVGIAVLRSITGEKTPPFVSTPSVRGVTSMSMMSWTSPAIMAACTAAPIATTSSGLMAEFMGLFAVNSLAMACTAGMREEPPTSTTSRTSLIFTPEPCRAIMTGPSSRSTMSRHSSSKCSRVKISSTCFGPSAPAATNGTEMRTSWSCERSIFARSLASVNRCSACLSWRKSIPSFCWKLSATQSTMRRSKSLPPRYVSPAVARTSQTPSPISSRETSKVPPPRSNTRIVEKFLWSRP
mmetsp:Transcript_42832/g.119214  ORF Transcript_42832/g.119214 Transcript_42832/m.119214 type:complete len:354 (-) Transcript_42832:361-1422(-)